MCFNVFLPAAQSELLRASWYYSASVFALWTLSCLELTLHQPFGSRVASDVMKSLLKYLPLGECLFSELPVRTFNAFLFCFVLFFYVLDHFSMKTGREDGKKTESDNMLQRSQDNFEPRMLKSGQLSPLRKVLFSALNSASQEQPFQAVCCS